MGDTMKSHTTFDKSLIYHNAEILLKALESKGRLNVKSILEALKHYIKKIETLSLENELFRNQLEKCRPSYKSKDEVNIVGMQQKIKELQKEIMLHRQVTDDRNQLRSQIYKMSSIIQNLLYKNENLSKDGARNNSCIAVIERERVQELLNKMLGIEGKIFEYKQKAANTSRLQKEVEDLKKELQEQRSKEYNRMKKINNQYNKKIELVESQLEICKKEKHLYEKLTKKLEVEAKKAINERIMYETKAQSLECKYDQLLFELEKTKAQNTDLLFRSPTNRDTLTKELKTSLRACRIQRDTAEKRCLEYEKKLKNALHTIATLRKKHTAPIEQLTKSKEIGFKTGPYTEFNECGDHKITSTFQENIEIHKDNTRSSSFRYWRKVSKNFNLLLKIVPYLPPPNGFKTEFLIKSKNDIEEMNNALAPSEEAINALIKNKTEQDRFILEHKMKVDNLIGEIRSAILGKQAFP